MIPGNTGHTTQTHLLGDQDEAAHPAEIKETDLGLPECIILEHFSCPSITLNQTTHISCTSMKILYEIKYAHIETR